MGFNISTFIISSIGTGLAVASANTFNQGLMYPRNTPN